MKEYIKTIIEGAVTEIILKHIPVESEPEGDGIRHEIEQMLLKRFTIVSNRIELLERKVNNLYKENKTLEQKYEFLMDTITDDQVDELREYCETHKI
jgi:acyl-[acyl carrier protein]--UDP-N-acetylglucosamine O-acyltransferase